MKPLSIILGFVPLIGFSFVAKRVADDGVAWAAVLGIVLVVVTMLMTKPVWPPSVLNVASLIPFAGIGVAGFTGGADVDAWLRDWAVPSVNILVGLIVLAMVPFAPFTARFARQSTPREYWGSPTFKKINTVLSAVWGLAIVAMGLCSLLVAVLDLSSADLGSSQLPELLFNWVLPIAIIVGAIKFTAAYPDRVTGDAPQRPAQVGSTR